MNKNFKRIIKFHDDENMIVISNLEINYHEDYPEFTMDNKRCNCYGQTEFIPKEGYQTELYNIWKQYHLNGMSAGLPIQTQAITKWKKQGNKYNYEVVCDYLKSIGLYEVDLKSNLPENMFIFGKEAIQDGETYKYGNGWVHCHLPEDFEDTLNELCDNIEEEEASRFEDGIENWDDIYDEDGNLREEVSNLEDEKIIALGIHLNITPIEAHEDIKQSNYNDCFYSYSGQEYLVCTDEEADELHDNELENYIDECFNIPKHLENYFDRESWKNDAKIDGRGHSLNPYDGIEYEEKVNNTYYYIYKQ